MRLSSHTLQPHRRVFCRVRLFSFLSFPRFFFLATRRSSEGNDFESARRRGALFYRRCLTIAECALPCKDLRVTRREGLPRVRAYITVAGRRRENREEKTARCAYSQYICRTFVPPSTCCIAPCVPAHL